MKHYACRGFTLIELLITVVIVGILATFAYPSLLAIIQNNRLASEQQQLLGLLNLARSEAIHRNQVVTVAHKSATAGDWSQGLQIYSDTDNGGNTAYDADTDTLVRDQAAAAFDIAIESSDAGDDGYISFRADGTLNEGGAGVTLAICDSRGETNGRQIQIGLSGRPDIESIDSCNP